MPCRGYRALSEARREGRRRRALLRRTGINNLGMNPLKHFKISLPTGETHGRGALLLADAKVGGVGVHGRGGPLAAASFWQDLVQLLKSLDFGFGFSWSFSWSFGWSLKLPISLELLLRLELRLRLELWLEIPLKVSATALA